MSTFVFLTFYGIHIQIPPEILKTSDGIGTDNPVAFVRVLQVPPTDTPFNASGHFVDTSCWGDAIFTQTLTQNGVSEQLNLVSSADASQGEEEYFVLYDGIQSWSTC